MTQSKFPVPFYIVDVFAEEKYAGNQLAVVRGDFPTDVMQKIALEMNYAETTFITSDTPRDGGYDVRIFTNNEELPFAGHPTLGTAYVIAREMIGGSVDTVTLNLKVGQIPVKFDGEMLWMTQKPAQFGDCFDPADFAGALDLDVDDMDTRFPIQTSSTGLPWVMTPLKTRDAVNRVRINSDAYRKLVEGTDGRWPLVFAPEPVNPENQLHARAFVVDHVGVWEDAATGSANGDLAGYLARYRYFGSKTVEARVEQGYPMRRPSLLLLRSHDHGDVVDVQVGGQVVSIARGELL
jgi:trans-2,3-dihydro-3-hydroxyanthranilate isomerase